MRYRKEKSRKWICRMAAACAGLLCAAVLWLYDAGEVLAQTQCTVTASSANIRASADTGSTVLASVLNGNKLTITEEVTGADGKVWYKVFIDADSQGYIRSDLVSKDGGGSTTTTTPASTTNTTPTTTPASNNTTPQINTSITVSTEGVEAVQPVSASVTKDQVRVRADSSTDSGIVTSVKKDVVLTVHGTKPGTGSEVWYQVSFVVDGTEVTGFIRSDFVSLSGELVPETEAPADEPQEPEDATPQEPVEEPKTYDTEEVDGVWYLADYAQGKKYPIADLFEVSEKNAQDLEKAQKKISTQNGIIIFLVIVLVLLVLGITLLVFKLKDMMDEDGLDASSLLPGRRSTDGRGQRTARQTGGTGRQPVARPAGTRSAGARPQTGQPGTRPAGARPQTGQPAARAAGARPQTGQPGTRPAGTRPQTGQPGTRPAGARPQAGQPGTRPAGARPQTGQPAARPTAARPAGTRPAPMAAEGAVERQAKANVEARGLERDRTTSQTWKSRNFLADDDEFEFEFLNWDGEEDK